MTTTLPGVEKLREELEGIEDYVKGYTLADAMREGSRVTNKAETWVDESNDAVCALAAARVALDARGIV